MKKYYFSLFLSLLFWGIWVGEGSLAPIQEDEGNILMPPSDTLTFWAQNFSFFGSGYYQTMGRLRATGNFAYIYTQEDTSSIVSLALNPNDPNRIFSAIADAGAGSGDEVFFYWTSDGSDNWNSSDMILFEYDPPIRALISHPTSSTSLRLFAATSRGVYSSTNQGVSWTAYNQDSLVGREILALTKSPYGISTNYTLYAGAFNGIWKRLSTSGQKWMRMPTTGLTDSIALSISSDPVNPDTVYIGTARGFFMWSPGGSNWIPLNNGLTDTFIQTITIDPIDGSRILVGTPSGVFLTSDGGSNWALKINGITNTDIRAIAIDPNSPGTLYAGTWGGGVFKSTDSGDNWVEKNSGFPIHRFGHFVSSLVVDPLSSNNLYAGTKRGIFKSSDGGSTWIEKNFGLLKTSFKDEIMDSLIEVFDNRIPADPSKGIYETSVNLLGTPPNVDGDSLIYIFVLDIKDLQGDGSQGSYNGYFDPVNQDTSHPFSNRKEILYLDAFPQDVSTLEAHQSLTHQFALMVHWNADSNEEKWVTEGVANYSEFKHGYVDTNASFLYPSGNSLNFWGDGTASAEKNISYLWTMYLYEIYGGENTIRTLVSDSRNGFEGVDSTLSSLGYFGRHPQIFSDWIVACYLDLPNPAYYAGKYGFDFLNVFGSKDWLQPGLTGGFPYLFEQSAWSGRYYFLYYQFLDPSALGDSIFFNGEDSKSYTFQVLKLDTIWTDPPGEGSVVIPVSLNGYNEGMVGVADFENGTYPSMALAVVTQGTKGSFLFDTTPLQGLPPQNLTAESGFPDSIPLRWDAPIVTEMELLGYNLYRSQTKGGPYTLIASGLTNVIFTDTTVINDVAYYYVVTANYTYGESEYSNEASGTASNFPPPKKLRSHSGDRVVLLLWDLPRDTTGLVGYNLYRSDTSEGPYSLIADSLVELYTYDYTVVNGDTFYYVVTALYSSPDGESPFSNEVMGTPEGGLGIEIMDPKANLPGTYSLYQNFPNPFYRETTIRFNLPHSGFVELRVYNLNGRLKQTLVNEERPAGQHSVLWDGKDSEGHFLPSGIYFYRMDTETFTQFRKLILLK